MGGLGNVNGWTEEHFQAVMRAAEESFAATARLRAILPPGPAARDRYHPTAPKLTGKPEKGVESWSVDVETTAPIHSKVDFELKSDQVGDEELATVLARRAGQALAAAEGRELFKAIWGKTTNEQPWDPKADKDALKRSINGALRTIQNANHLGPHALVMTPELHAAYRELLFSNNNRLFLGDALGGDLRDAGVPAGGDLVEPVEDGRGLLISVGVSTVELTEIDPLALSLVEYARDKMVFRLETRVAVRVLDPTGIVKIEKKEEPPPTKPDPIAIAMEKLGKTLAEALQPKPAEGAKAGVPPKASGKNG